jgi:hypothetical protein
MNAYRKRVADNATTPIRIAIVWAFMVGPAPTQEPHQHRRSDDIQQYRERLDRTERDQYQKPLQVIDALNLKPGIAVADIGSKSGCPQHQGPFTSILA